MKDELNFEPRELSIEELDNAAGGRSVCGLPLIVVAVAAGAALRGLIGSFLRMF